MRRPVHASTPRTRLDRYNDALRFLAMARDHVIRDATPESICAMWGVDTAAQRESIAGMLKAAKARVS